MSLPFSSRIHVFAPAEENAGAKFNLFPADLFSVESDFL